MYLGYNTASIEKLGKPAVLLAHPDFIHDARTGVTVRGVPALRILSTPIYANPMGETQEQVIRDGLSKVLDKLIDAMTRPLTPEEESPQPKEGEKTSGIVFKGDLREVNTFFYKRGWSYGYPIIPPTKDLVDEMLEASPLPPETVLARIPPRNGNLTVEKLAINAVMAGALPTYMPVLIAAAKTLMRPTMKLEGYLCSMVSGGFFWVVNGPIRHELNVHSGIGLLSPDKIPNTAIAATMGLVGRNVGGSRPGVECMSTMGYPGKYAMCMAENEEDSPWEPLHVELGLNKEDNAITVFGGNCWQRCFPYGTDAEGIIRGICYNMSMSTGHGIAGGFIISPADAKILADKGWTKQELAFYLGEYARVPAWRHPLAAKGNPPGEAPNFKLRERWPVDEHFQVALLIPEQVRFVVAGIEDAVIHCYAGKRFGNAYGGAETQKIELPPNWNKLVQKYKDVVPTYARY